MRTNTHGCTPARAHARAHWRAFLHLSVRACARAPPVRAHQVHKGWLSFAASTCTDPHHERPVGGSHGRLGCPILHGASGGAANVHWLLHMRTVNEQIHIEFIQRVSENKHEGIPVPNPPSSAIYCTKNPVRLVEAPHGSNGQSGWIFYRNSFMLVVNGTAQENL